VFTTIGMPIVRVPAAPLPVGLNIVIPVIRIGSSPGLLPATLAFPLTVSGSAELLTRGLRTGVKEFVTSGTTSLFHTKLLFDGNRFRESWPRELYQQIIGVLC
jgi:hypothetical protein